MTVGAEKRSLVGVVLRRGLPFQTHGLAEFSAFGVVLIDMLARLM